MNQRDLPAEWAPQSGVMLTWPHPHGDWRPHLDAVEPVFAAIAHEVARREGLLVVCFDPAHRDHVREYLKKAGVEMARVHLAIAPSNDTWARDHGPITVVENGTPRLLDFTFNGWGRKYPADLDNALNARLAARGVFGAPLEHIDLVLEGGAIDSDGEGTLLTTESCLLDPKRNPHLTKGRIEARLKRHLGVDRVLWLRHGHLIGDDTDGHIDTLARFCSADTIAHVVCRDRGDPHHPALAAMERELRNLRRRNGLPYRLVPLPLPAPIHDEKGQRLPATHANFLVINGAVLVPTYGDPSDREALDNLADAFPGRTIVPIDCRPLIMQYGSLHCVTMQLPEGVLRRP